MAHDNLTDPRSKVVLEMFAVCIDRNEDPDNFVYYTT
jgi:hypothetical protein